MTKAPVLRSLLFVPGNQPRMLEKALGLAPDAYVPDLEDSVPLEEKENALIRVAALRIDLGVVRGIAYYTGFVFEVFETGGPSRALAGGGRYNDLAQRLGYADMPAVGFGMGDVVLTDLLERKRLLAPRGDALDLYAIIGGPEERCLALADVDRLRTLGFRVEYALREVGFGRQFRLAGQSGARLALIYGAEERTCDVVKLRDLVEGGECNVARSQLDARLPGMLSSGIEGDA